MGDGVPLVGAPCMAGMHVSLDRQGQKKFIEQGGFSK